MSWMNQMNHFMVKEESSSSLYTSNGITSTWEPGKIAEILENNNIVGTW